MDTYARVQWHGEPLALLVDSDADGRYLMPPVVIDPTGDVLMGREVLAAMSVSGTTVVPVPVIKDASPGDLARIEQALAEVSAELGVEVPKANYIIEGNEA